MNVSDKKITEFREQVWEYYRSHGRSMPWRDHPEPYSVMVSEIMLQQTQVERVKPKFAAFLRHFPDVQSLAQTSLADVLTVWSGLGYNRRAKFLWQAARMIVEDFNGHMPHTFDELKKLPGIGQNTAGAIMAYAYNQPVVFIETNIRTVFFHHFFADSPEAISDAELRQLVGQTLDTETPRQWYWALMDYGTFLKKTAGGRLTQSKHYKKQSPLQGSLREMRGRILRALIDGPLAEPVLREQVTADARYELALTALVEEAMIHSANGRIRLTD